jgi:cell division protein ZapA
LEEKLSIKLHIANRIYPMKIDRNSEEYIRNAVKEIDVRLKFYEDNYAIKDKQDLLAMCLIEYASKYKSFSNKNIVDDKDLINNLSKIESLLDENI